MTIRSNFDNEIYCHIKIGTNWCLFIHYVMRDTVISRSAPIGASLFVLTVMRDTITSRLAPIGASSF